MASGEAHNSKTENTSFPKNVKRKRRSINFSRPREPKVEVPRTEPSSDCEIIGVDHVPRSKKDLVAPLPNKQRAGVRTRYRRDGAIEAETGFGFTTEAVEEPTHPAPKAEILHTERTSPKEMESAAQQGLDARPEQERIDISEMLIRHSTEVVVTKKRMRGQTEGRSEKKKGQVRASKRSKPATPTSKKQASGDTQKTPV